MDFSGQNLSGYSFRGQNLNGADFSGADLRGTDFSGADLRGADFSHAKLGMRFPRLRSALIALLLVAASISCAVSWKLLLDFNRLDNASFRAVVYSHSSHLHTTVLVAIYGLATLAGYLLSPYLSTGLARAKPYGMESGQALPDWARLSDRCFNLWGLTLSILLFMIAAGLLQQANQVVSRRITTDPVFVADFLEGSFFVGGGATLLVMLGLLLGTALLQIWQQSPDARFKGWMFTGLIAIVAGALGQLFPAVIILPGLAYGAMNVASLGFLPVGIISAGIYGAIGAVLGRWRWSLPVTIAMICLLLSPGLQRPIQLLQALLILGMAWIPCGIFVLANQATRFHGAKWG